MPVAGGQMDRQVSAVHLLFLSLLSFLLLFSEAFLENYRI